MIPLYDENPTRTFPLVTVLLIVINVLVFLYELILPSQEALNQFVQQMGVIPYEVVHNFAPQPAMSIFTSMFVHGGWMHLLGNMLYLWIFGNNIEDAMGHIGFFLFYFLCGIGASAAQVAVDSSSLIPNIGASGAIAGVLGAYLLLYPRASVMSLVFFGYFIRLVRVPALIVLGFWIVIQLVSGLASLGVPSAGGIAWFAHVGGFLSGLILVYPLYRRRRRVSYG